MASPDNQIGITPEETPIPLDERGQTAYSLIQKFKLGIAHVPEFSQALTERYFAEVSRTRNNPKDGSPSSGDTIYYRRGGCVFGVKYESGIESESLSVTMTSVNTEGKFNEHGLISLIVFFNSADGGIIYGHVAYLHASIDNKEGGSQEYQNIHAARKKVEEFLTTNFSEV